MQFRSLWQPSSNFSKLQRIQNATARIVLRDYTRPSIDILKTLHWLPIHLRVQFKLATLTHKALTLKQPSYLYSLLTSYQPARTLRSSTLGLLSQPSTSTVIGTRAFRSASPSIWNSLPLEVRSAGATSSFRSKLKSHLFCKF